MKTSRFLAPVLLVLLLAGEAFGQIWCVAAPMANLRSSPSLTGSLVVLQVPRHYPLEVREETGDFFHVRDYRGQDSWIKKEAVSHDNGVVVQVDTANLRRGPGPNYPVVFRARQGVTFKVLDDQSDWLFVEHESGKQGWIYRSLVWGL